MAPNSSDIQPLEKMGFLLTGWKHYEVLMQSQTFRVTGTDCPIVPIPWIRGSVKKPFVGCWHLCGKVDTRHTLWSFGAWQRWKNFDMWSADVVEQLVPCQENQTTWNPFLFFPCLVEARWLGREWGMPDRRWTWRSKKVSFPLRWTQAYGRAAPLFDQAAFSWSCKYGGKIF